MSVLTRSKVLVSCLALLPAFLAAGCSPSSSVPKKRPTGLRVVEAPSLFEIYEKNEVSADAAYKDKVFAVSGIIHGVGRDILGTPYVTLRIGKNEMFAVQCMFSARDEAALARLSPGEEVTIAGTGGGKMMNVLLVDCWFY